MNLRAKLNTYGDVTLRLIRYNLKIIFANKFFYFLLAALAFFAIVTIINVFSENPPTEATVYYLLLLPGLLVIFYPTVFGIQSDVDARMIEIIFGIPNYRYKVWLVRLLLVAVVVAVVLVVLSIVSSLALVHVRVPEMVYQLMHPVFFLGALAFMVSTLVRNGNGTAVVMVVVGLAFWIAGGMLRTSRWNLFLNPFQTPSNLNEAIWASVVANNRLYMLIGMTAAILFGLLNLQKREKFIS
ncbi:MAG: hypothetical protein ONB17_03405 [candidate division KSB1 bacterium]|nr:hypothetical protein [candidate division KSB1 bacterium]MDZ7294075.1 hypothetical protein [candidate division KSB1 bacterium]MDZ7378451.1 hypothetical protein [candidate division KSB1 bacterium]MDZ7386226.1 hypothetical protein [candidate division KSB1 bacterium]